MSENLKSLLIIKGCSSLLLPDYKSSQGHRLLASSQSTAREKQVKLWLKDHILLMSEHMKLKCIYFLNYFNRP